MAPRVYVAVLLADVRPLAGPLPASRCGSSQRGITARSSTCTGGAYPANLHTGEPPDLGVGHAVIVPQVQVAAEKRPHGRHDGRRAALESVCTDTTTRRPSPAPRGSQSLT